ncbi:hypothetical protein SODALDRAFT_290415 [Sodiomyces alkalinus F11]|uniref:IPT/TIG domain-containing protein n=1 Tax=Sodiomyces alkalinus (strain CBS 110278 / VKM F-3762 / F11) TaxID=1314773 RepID=A0A3N2Q113_SODAK|nr:hypothetical protein SODALDRAFT_290415 [Sodiomyces alkalinus F11]ROT40305.1 hypothetical protein SODALDRAFT_290415 [Sodiomyces alkalinus F11]
MTDAGAGVGASSLIAGTDMTATGEFSEFFDYDNANVLSAAASPARTRTRTRDPLHTTLGLDFGLSNDQDLESFNSIPPKVSSQYPPKATPTDNRAAESPDSAHDDSFRDSSSDSCFSKRTGSSSSEKTTFSAGDVTMADGPDTTNQEWDISDDSPDFQPSGCNATFLFGSADMSSSLTSAAPGVLCGGDADHRQITDDSFMNESFDFESASSSPQAINHIPPPSHALSPPNASSDAIQANMTPSRVEDLARSRHSHQFPQTMNAFHMSASRETSPFSQPLPHHPAPFSTFFNNSPSPTNVADVQQQQQQGMAAPIKPGAFWPSAVDMPDINHGYAMIPPYFSHMMHHAAFFGQPPYSNFSFQGQLFIHETPPKSRVETQIPIKMTLLGAPPTIKRLHLPTHTISKPKLLAKPPAERSPDTLELYVQLVCTTAMQNENNKRRALQRAAEASHPPIQGPPADVDMEENKTANGGEVRICKGCIMRERKRAGRKKIKKLEEEEMWKKDENRRVIVFNTKEIKDWQPCTGAGRAGALQVDAPMRIACYCRHQSEKMGFQVIFTIKDWHDRVVAQAVSPSIMITDDHKTHPALHMLPAPAPETSMPTTSPPADNTSSSSSSSSSSLSANTTVAPPPPPSLHQAPSPGHVSTSTTPAKGSPAPTTPQTAACSRPASPSSAPGPASKKRKASGCRLPMEMTMTRLDTSAAADGAHPPAAAAAAQTVVSASAAMSPFSTGLTLPPADGFFGQNSPTGTGTPGGSRALSVGPTSPGNANTANGQDPELYNAGRPVSLDSLAAHTFSAPASTQHSRAPSPSMIRQSPGTLPQQAPLPQGPVTSLPFFANGVHAANGVHGVNGVGGIHGVNGINGVNGANAATPPRPPPTIHKIIPNRGPKLGGIEVTILGANFFQGLDVYFGDQRATTTTFWGESSLVCLLPPRAMAGLVPVTLRQPQGQSQPFTHIPPHMFEYIDDEEAVTMKLLISAISHKMTGQYLGVRDLAQRIIGSDPDAWASFTAGSGSGSGSGGNNFGLDTEPQLMKCLELIDLDDSPRVARLDLRTHTGQTLLHLGCSLGYHRFVAGLLARGADPDLRDRGGYTPMHMAAISGHEVIVRRLIQAGADPTIRSLSGDLPADVARSQEVMEHIRRCERHVRSQSRSSLRSLHSRANSAVSLRSLWDADGMSGKSDDGAGDSEESPEYSSGDFEDEDEWLDVQGRRLNAVERQHSPAEVQEAEPQTVPGSPRTALAASVRDQFAAQLQQLQQSMAAMHLPNLSQMPNLPNLPQMPALPRMPMLPDYHAYLQQHPLMGRMTSLMPGMLGPRPGSAGEGDDASRPMDFKWWDLSAMLLNSISISSSSSSKAADGTVPPPAYSEIFPRDVVDKKQASAAQAAAEAEADNKCARLYDSETAEGTVAEAEAEAEAGESSTSQLSLPKALRIGRKKAITKEQQQDFLRMHAVKFKGVRSDKNLWFIWIPLLTCILAAMLYIRFPQAYAGAWSMIRSVLPANEVPTVVRNFPDGVVEVL